jgi:hypothetical protein
MIGSAAFSPVRRLLVRTFGRGQSAGGLGEDPSSDIKLISPEQRLLGVVARYGKGARNAQVVAADDAGSRQASNGAAVPALPVDGSDGFAPTWVRRLADPGPAETEPTAVPEARTRPAGPRRPRRP